jgi:regulator of replication initiation timing
MFNFLIVKNKMRKLAIILLGILLTGSVGLFAQYDTTVRQGATPTSNTATPHPDNSSNVSKPGTENKGGKENPPKENSAAQEKGSGSNNAGPGTENKGGKENPPKENSAVQKKGSESDRAGTEEPQLPLSDNTPSSETEANTNQDTGEPKSDNSSADTEVAKEEGEVFLCSDEELRKIKFLICFILAALLLGFGLFLFLLNKKKNKEISKFKDDIEEYRLRVEELEKEKSNLEGGKSNLSNEKGRLEKENERLKEELRQLQQKQQSSHEQKQQFAAPSQSQSQSFSLYADSIFEGKFNRVRETPNEDTIFELKLNHTDDTRANIVVYHEAYRKVTANPAYLEGCEKQVLGNSNVKMQKEGIATKDSNGNWIIKTKPEAIIS